jgi:hypothetical protein
MSRMEREFRKIVREMVAPGVLTENRAPLLEQLERLKRVDVNNAGE